MDLIAVNEAGTWDKALLALPNPHLLQSWAWGALKARQGWQATRLLFKERDSTVAAATVLQRKVPRLPVSVLYVPKGPALDWRDTALAARVLDELERLARARRAIQLKIDPDVYYSEDAPAFAGRPANAPALAGLLAERGWCFSPEQIQFRNTALLDLDRDEEVLLAAMKQGTRRNVRLAGRRGVAVREGGPPDLETFYRLYRETADRAGFAIRAADYYYDAWGSLLAAGQACLLLAEVEAEAVAGLILTTFGPTAWYMYGASSERHRNLYPNNLLQWQAMQRARAAGCRLYDLWGAPDELVESDPMWGVYRFKLGFGAELARGLGAWDYAPGRLRYRLYHELVPCYLAWLRRRGRGH
ncbi:MAG: peptidoglycan bridge formation glycyltransferase FemA/FemB family protein [Anaerolineae bacterium]|jgi:lipid II:glycine glycyltransferase (peptidoglycan interpeptide bridge formation enzyme)